MKTSLIIATYNWPEALEVCIKSVFNQKMLPDEILIADDGSDARTKAVIDALSEESPVPIQHIWHPDKGFRLASIRNKAIVEAKGDYIIQIDGDLFLHPYFIKDHIDFAKKNSVVRASRINLDPVLSRKILTGQVSGFTLFQKGITNATSALRLPFLWHLFETSYKSRGSERYKIYGCNMAYWREDAIRVNGYNEKFEGWGPEDSEFVARLLNAGVQKRFMKFGGLGFHIYHKENSKSRLTRNREILHATISTRATFCEKGIEQYLFKYELS